MAAMKMSVESSHKPLVGNKAPYFEAEAAVDGAIKKISLQDYAGKYVLLLFYPMDFTFVCPTEILAFGKRKQEFEALNAEVLAMSTDSVFSHLAWTKMAVKEGGIQSTELALVSDITKTISRSYRVLTDEGVALRGLFVIDPHGVVRHMLVNDLGIGRSVDEAIRTVQALVEHTKSGGVCPANWAPGSDTIVPSPAEAKEFFKTLG
ncbi:MAG: 2-Cys peroxiredoxin [Amphiamblys sp. WSBS2006]|nr:MAG: 2-Cys peroxiredoxin [Amphiamblys sp. WSBS2006]